MHSSESDFHQAQGIQAVVPEFSPMWPEAFVVASRAPVVLGFSGTTTHVRTHIFKHSSHECKINKNKSKNVNVLSFTSFNSLMNFFRVYLFICGVRTHACHSRYVQVRGCPGAWTLVILGYLPLRPWPLSYLISLFTFYFQVGFSLSCFRLVWILLCSPRGPWTVGFETSFCVALVGMSLFEVEDDLECPTHSCVCSLLTCSDRIWTPGLL